MMNYLYEYPEYTTLLIPGNTLVDKSFITKPLTINNAVYSSTQYKYYNASSYFNVVSSYVTFYGLNVIDFGTGDFTVEAWVWSNTAPGGGANYDKCIVGIFSSTPQFVFFLRNHDLKLCLWDGTNENPSTIDVSPSVWTHVAICRSAGVLRMFINGVQCFYNASYLLNFSSMSYNINIGSATTTRSLGGYMQDLRITKGLARYTSNFTPPKSLIQTISGKVDRTVANPITRVQVRPWLGDRTAGVTASAISQAIPDANGNWSVEIPRGKFDVSFFNNVNPPRIEGPYDYTDYET